MVTADIGVVEPDMVYRKGVVDVTPIPTVAARKAETGTKTSKKKNIIFRVSGIRRTPFLSKKPTTDPKN
jgi:hypothetical protein